MLQRRRHPRYRVQQHVWCGDDAHSYYVRVADVSLGGLFLRLPGVEVGRRLRVRFRPEDGEAVELVAEAVWSGPAARGRLGVGLKIVTIEAGAESFERFVRAAAAG